LLFCYRSNTGNVLQLHLRFSVYSHKSTSVNTYADSELIW